MEGLFTSENAIALLTLTLLEIVLGIDNVVFISILAARLPEASRARARQVGLALALFSRVLLLLGIRWLTGLTAALFEVFGHTFSGRDLILLAGGLFLVGKATFEIHDKLEGDEQVVGHPGASGRFANVITQILVLDIVFSVDSVITAVGMAQSLAVMIAAIAIAIGVMLAFAGAISEFIERHPTMKMLALSFLILIGVVLMLEGFGKHVEKGYIYFAMAFSLLVELLNLRLRKPPAHPVHLRHTPDADPGP